MDTLEKKTLSTEDIAFLENLKKAINEEHKPSYFTISGTRKIQVESRDDAHSVQYYDDDNYEILANSNEELAEWINEVYPEYETVFEDIDYGVITVYAYDNEINFGVASDLPHLSHYLGTPIRARYYRHEFVPQTTLVFLTRKEAEDYLAKYAHHFSEDAKVVEIYNNSAKDFAHLIDIVADTNWESLK